MRQARAGHWLSWDRVLAGVMLAGIAGLAGWGLSIELQASPIQSRLFSKMASGFHYSVEPGPNRDARFPKPDRMTSGLGTRLPAFIHALEQQGFVVTQQARLSPELTRFVDNGGFAVFREKAQAGVVLKDRAGGVLYVSRYPERVFADFTAIPRLVVDTLLFIEIVNCSMTDIPPATLRSSGTGSLRPSPTP